jgi:hypothetical protein
LQMHQRDELLARLGLYQIPVHDGLVMRI